MVESNVIREFKVELPKFETRYVNGKDVVFYMVHVCSGRRKWKCEKRYSDFDSLDVEMRKKHPNLPKLPGKTYFFKMR